MLCLILKENSTFLFCSSLLGIIELLGNQMYSGELGPSTIVGPGPCILGLSITSKSFEELELCENASTRQLLDSKAGSAAFNLLVIIAVCISAIPEGQA